MGRGALRSVEDPFKLEDNAYDRKKFYTRAVDDKGHKETIHTPVPPSIYAQVGQIIESKVIPEYKSQQAFVRDAIYHRLHEVGAWLENGEIERVVSVEMMRCRREFQLAELEEMEHLIERTDAMLQKANQLQDFEMMRLAIDEGWRDAEQIREPYASRLGKVLKRYQTLLKD